MARLVYIIELIGFCLQLVPKGVSFAVSFRYHSGGKGYHTDICARVQNIPRKLQTQKFSVRSASLLLLFVCSSNGKNDTARRA